MYTYDRAPRLKEQPRRLPAGERHRVLRGVASRFITAAETAALLEITEEVLRRWRVTGEGPQPVPRPGGWLYLARHVECLAALPRWRRMLAIYLRRD